MQKIALLLAPQTRDCYFFVCKHGACPPADFLEVSIFLPAVDAATASRFRCPERI
ncbi:MAG TPA: hypothetical protein VK742_03285 [Candidatus Sulfotelmatobacter sp.]|nr:hypothetical protein [Candidatus Sulfotelmatobacter sp.]